MTIWFERTAIANEPVDLQLILAIDCSYSVNKQEFTQQVVGIARALRNPKVMNAVRSGPIGSVAITVVQCSDIAYETVAVPWTRIDSDTSILALADRIETLPRYTELGATSISSVIRFSGSLFDQSPYRGERQVIDISGDGRNNRGDNVRVARDLALLRGTVINGLAITNEHRTLDYYYRDWVIGGPGAFVIKAEDYGDYGRAIQKKLLREIQYIPIAERPPRPPENQLASQKKSKLGLLD